MSVDVGSPYASHPRDPIRIARSERTAKPIVAFALGTTTNAARSRLN